MIAIPSYRDDAASWSGFIHATTTVTSPPPGQHWVMHDGVDYVHGDDLRAYWSNRMQEIARSVREFTGGAA